MLLQSKSIFNILDEDNKISENVDNENSVPENSFLAKSLSVQNQVNKWEKLVEISIHFEKCVQAANILPSQEKFRDFSQKEEFENNINETKRTCTNILNNMLELKNYCKLNVDEAPINKSEIISNELNCTKYATNELQKNFENTIPYRNDVLEKWFSRTYLTSNDKSNTSMAKKIEDLMTNKNNLLNRSRTLNQHYLQKLMPLKFGKNSGENNQNKIVAGDVYDDTDFYLSLLQEVIDFKSNSGSKSKNMKDKISILNLVRQKMKRDVDKKATKGRKIRYTVHNKLVNFMPINPSATFEDNQRNILFQSLFN